MINLRRHTTKPTPPTTRAEPARTDTSSRTLGNGARHARTAVARYGEKLTVVGRAQGAQRSRTCGSAWRCGGIAPVNVDPAAPTAPSDVHDRHLGRLRL